VALCTSETDAILHWIIPPLESFGDTASKWEASTHPMFIIQLFWDTSSDFPRTLFATANQIVGLVSFSDRVPLITRGRKEFLVWTDV